MAFPLPRAWLRPWPNRLLLLVLALGTLLRVALLARWRPGFVGYPDTGAYLLDAFDPSYPFLDPLRPVGYGVVLHLLHGLTAKLTVVIVLQHALGLATAVGLFALVRALGVRSRWIALAPAAVVALGGWQVLFEHTVLSEAIWFPLVVAGLLAVAAGAEQGGRAAAFALVVTGGLLLGLSVPVRLISAFLLPVVALWLLLACAAPRRRRVALTGLLLLAAALPVLGFSQWQADRTGRFGLSRNGVMNLYGRVAPWADCSKFTPPAGTAFLCEQRPVAERPGHDAYIFAPSPATTRFAVGDLTGVLSPAGARQVGRWTRAAILGQPLTYLHAVASESRRLLDPSASSSLPGQMRGGYGAGPDAYQGLLLSQDRDIFVLPTIQAHYPMSHYIYRGDTQPFFDYAELTRPGMLLMAAFLALGLLAPLVARGPERRAALLLMPVALVLLLAPVATATYDYRYVVPAYGPLIASASIGLWGAVLATRARRRA